LHEFFLDLSPRNILKKLSLYKRREIIPGSTLIIFDEIQACPEAITSLKYFQEEANEYHIIALGSLLGVSVNRGSFSFPVGKVQFMTLYPLDFEEYLMARGEDGLIGLIRECFASDKPLDHAFHDRALDYYKEYLFVGGMPEAVEEFYLSLSKFPHIEVCGLMTMGPVCENEEEIRPYFALTKRIFDDIKTRHGFVGEGILSMGMSDSYRVAIEEGSTLVRIGRRLFKK
jgi:hypothetical protein